MKTVLRVPPHFQEYEGDPIISNFDHLINTVAETAIKEKALFSRFAAWNFNGIVWWNDELGYWCVEVWIHWEYKASFLAESLPVLGDEVNMHYGGNEPINWSFE